jgi:hypothetical protein
MNNQATNVMPCEDNYKNKIDTMNNVSNASSLTNEPASPAENKSASDWNWRLETDTGALFMGMFG